MNITRRTPEHLAPGVRSNSSPSLFATQSRPQYHVYEQQPQYNTPSKYFSGRETQQSSYRDDESISDASTIRSHQHCLNEQQSPSSVDGSYASSDSVPSSLLRERTLSQCSINVSPARNSFEDALSSPPLYERYANLQISKPSKQLLVWGEDFDALHFKQNQSRTRKTSAVYQQLINSSYMRRYRSVVCDWFFEIQYAVSILQRTIHVATFYMDLCMFKLYSENRVVGSSTNNQSREGLFNIKQYLQLLAACCLWIATKRDETYGDSKLKLDNLIQYCCNTYTKQEFQQMEIFVLDLLEWELEDTPSIDFLETMLVADNQNFDLGGDDEEDPTMKDEEDTHFTAFKETVKQYSSMVMDASLLGTLSTRQSDDSLERLKQHFNIIVPCHLEQHFEHTYISMWITMLNYPSLMALSSLLLGLFLYHQYDAPFESGQMLFDIQPSASTFRNRQSDSSTELFDEVLTHYWTVEMEENVGYNFEQVAICSRILYTFFQREQAQKEMMNGEQSLSPSQAHYQQSHEVTSVVHHEPQNVPGLDPCYDLVCDEQL
ncbi:hypothetical protein C9374_000953 [Naegleria lovaniensis]|uniref:Cyclin-like domain-containing protein n=1 Tax=Naegleria lovaniensis TaxID=51637 RepID=A0AA88KN08_NAELO|nr:uncharacterized protein C9374_000953 [Naegleria lovaniensis]KAG2388103.1 hypothetical protein C9374_000953 [Naegleria lovaniensis]